MEISEKEFKDAIELAHMEGQRNQGCKEPSYYEAMSYYENNIKKPMSEGKRQRVFIDANEKIVKDGDIIDMHQTINGQNKFLVVKTYPLDIRYFDDFSRKYEYDMYDLLKQCPLSGTVEYDVIDNIKRYTF